jgi:hypothetical protein
MKAKNVAGLFGVAVFLLLAAFGVATEDGASITLGIVFAAMCAYGMRR